VFFVLKSSNSVPFELTVTMTHPLWVILEVSQGLKKARFLQYGMAMFVKSLREISTSSCYVQNCVVLFKTRRLQTPTANAHK